MRGRHKIVPLFCIFISFLPMSQSGLSPEPKFTPEIPPNTTDDPMRPGLRHLEQLLKNLTSTAVKRALPSMMVIMENANLSSNCVTSLLKYVSALKQIKVWAMKMLDATAKIPSGVFEGTVTEIGSFDQCLKIIVHNRKGVEDFRGQYCSVEVIPPLGPKPGNLTFAVRSKAKFDDSIMEDIQTTIYAFYRLTMRFGVCIPSTCSKQDMQSLMQEVVKPLRYGLRIAKCHVAEPIKVEPIHIVVLSITSFFFLLLIIGSIIDSRYFITCVTEGKSLVRGFLLQVVTAFSFPKNFQKLVSVDSANLEMKCIHGIRALSMAWVILGHTYIWINFQTLKESRKAAGWFNNIEFEVILNGWLSVTSFIFLSGLLTTQSTLTYLEKRNGKMNVFLYAARRFLRLYPSLLLILGAIFFLPWVATGPFWPELPGIEVDNCRKYWWTNMLFINNWRPIQQMCMQHSWYLSADLQLHIIALLVLIPLYRNMWLGMIAGIVLSIAGTLAVGIITYVNGYDPTLLVSTANIGQMYRIAEEIHIKTFTYFGPYCVGIAVGYSLLKYPKVKLRSAVLLVGWCAALVLSISSLYGTHRWNIGLFPSAGVTALYAALHRTTFVLGLAWVTFVCVTGNSGLVSYILASRPFVIVSRLTFMAYLAQGPVIWTRYGSIKERLFYSHYNMLYEYVGNVFLSLMVAFAAHMLVEAPFANLERLLFAALGGIKPEAGSDNDSNLTHVETSSEKPKDIPWCNGDHHVHCRTVSKLYSVDS